MEIELKYSIADELTADRIWDDELLLSYEEENTREAIKMKASFFDTEDHALLKNDIAFRVRMEGNRVVASLKWNGNAEGALHQRQEINVPIGDETCFLMPSAEVFKESDIGQEVIRLVAGRPLISLLDVTFIRRRFRIDVNDSIMEVSLDRGDIITDNGRLPILELEIELFSGEKDELTAIGQKIMEKYSLSECVESKYARGLQLLGLK